MPNKQSNTRTAGIKGEDLASKFLLDKGYKIIDKNFHSRFGEIDIIATFNNALIFVEVKTRWSDKFGSPAEAVTPTKLRNIQKTAEYFCLLNPTLPKKLLIEVVSIDMTKGPAPEIKLIPVY